MIRRALLCGASLLAFAVPASASMGDLNTATQDWLRTTLQQPIPARPLVSADTSACGGNLYSVGALGNCEALAWADRIEVSPDAAGALDYLSTHRDDLTGAGYLLIHENLHRALFVGDNLELEEKTVDSLAADFYAPWCAAMRKRCGLVGTSYDDNLVRRASALATGTPWRGRDARLWRRSLWAASLTTRATMVADAYATTGGAS